MPDLILTENRRPIFVRSTGRFISERPPHQFRTLLMGFRSPRTSQGLNMLVSARGPAFSCE